MVTVPYCLPSRASVNQLAVQTPEAGPQEEVVVIITSSVEAAQGALEIVPRKVVAPMVNPEVGPVAVVMVPTPATSVHALVPVVGVLPARVATVVHTA